MKKVISFEILIPYIHSTWIGGNKHCDKGGFINAQIPALWGTMGGNPQSGFDRISLRNLYDVGVGGIPPQVSTSRLHPPKH